MPGVEHQDGEHDGDGRACVEADRDPQPQGLVEKDVGVDRDVVHTVEQLG
jgi:hypothetical protein